MSAADTMTNKSLYTPSEIKAERERLVKLQKGIDPILQEPFSETVALDHSHETQHVRAALNRNTNAFEGLVVNAHKRCLQWLTDVPLPTILRNLAKYLEGDYSNNPYHNGWLKRVKIDFRKLNAQQQGKVLKELGSESGSNSAERLKLFSAKILDRSLGYDIIRNAISASSQKE